MRACGWRRAGAAGCVEAAAPSDSLLQTTCLSEEQTRRHVAEHARGLLSHPAVNRGVGGRYIIHCSVFASPPPRLSDLSDKTCDKSEGLGVHAMRLNVHSGGKQSVFFLIGPSEETHSLQDSLVKCRLSPCIAHQTHHLLLHPCLPSKKNGVLLRRPST